MGNVIMEATQINYRRDEKLKTVDQKLQELSQESAIDTDIAPVFKSNITYHPGDLVYYRNKLYVFTAEHTGAWAAGDVTATDVSTAMNTALAGKTDYADIAGAFNAETAYTAGDLVIYNGIIYRCTNDHTGEWDADDFSATTIGAELNAINSNISSLVKYEDVTDIKPASDMSAGTIGTRGAQVMVDYNKPTGYVISHILITNITNSSYFIPSVFMAGSTIYINYYRATDQLVSKDSLDVSVRIFYTKATSV